MSVSRIFEVISGLWSSVSNGYKGNVDDSDTARCVRGNESDIDYEVKATVKIASGIAGIIVNYTVDEDWLQYYLEMLLDPENNKVRLDAVIRNADFTENTRVTLASRDWTIEPATEYKCYVKSVTLSGGAKAVYCMIDRLMVLAAEDLADSFNVGQHGFEAFDEAGEYAEFLNYHYRSLVGSYCDLSEVKGVLLLSLDETEYDAKIQELIVSGDTLVDLQFEAHDVSMSTPTPQAVRDASKYYTAFFYRRAMDPTAAETFKAEAEMILKKYFETKQSVPFIVASDDADLS